MSLKVGILGAGHMGRVHGQILAQDERLKLIGVADKDEEKAKELANLLETKSFSSLGDLVGKNPEAVYITTSNTTHAELTLKLLKEKIHIFCEKPMATSLSKARKILEMVKKENIIYQAGHNRRFAPVYKSVKKIVEKGEIIPYLAQIKMNRGELEKPPWVSDPQITGGFLYESTLHLLDMIRWLLGEVETVECLARSNVYSESDDFAVLLTFNSGKIATLASSAHASWIFPFERIEIFGKHSTIITEEMERLSCFLGLNEKIITRDYSQYPMERKWGYLEEDRLFVEAIMNQEKSPVSVYEAYKSIELVEACYQSSKKNIRVKLPL